MTTDNRDDSDRLQEDWALRLRAMAPRSDRTPACLPLPRLVEDEQGAALSASEQQHVAACPHCQRAQQRLAHHQPSTVEVGLQWVRRATGQVLEAITAAQMPEPAQERVRALLARHLIPLTDVAASGEAPTVEEAPDAPPIAFENRIAVLPRVLPRPGGRFEVCLGVVDLNGEEPEAVADGTPVTLVREGTVVARQHTNEYGQARFEDLEPGRWEFSFDAYPRIVLVLQSPPT